MTAPTTGSRTLAVPSVQAGRPAAKMLVAQLRDAAGGMVAFSTTKRLLREAASMIERLDRETP